MAVKISEEESSASSFSAISSRCVAALALSKGVVFGSSGESEDSSNTDAAQALGDSGLVPGKNPS